MPFNTRTRAAQKQEAGRLRLEYLDGLRAIAAIFVVMHHNLYEIWPLADTTAPYWTRVLTYGHISVDIFIALSGFCLMLPVAGGTGDLRGGALLFFKKRARRILPPYYAAVAVSLLLVFTVIGKVTGTHWDHSLPVTKHSILIHALLLQNFSTRDIFTIDYPLWSVSLEWWIYFLFPPLVWAWKRLGVIPTTLMACIASYALCHICVHRFGQPFSLQYIALFVAGMLACEIVHGHSSFLSRLQGRIPWGIITLIMTAIAVLAITKHIPHFTKEYKSDAIVGVWALCLLTYLGIRLDNPLRRILSYKTTVFFGSFGYSIYLIHAPLIHIVNLYFVRPLHISSTASLLVLEFVGLPLAVGVAYLFHLAFERPFMNTKPGVRIKTEAQAEVAAVESPAP